MRQKRPRQNYRNQRQSSPHQQIPKGSGGNSREDPERVRGHARSAAYDAIHDLYTSTRWRKLRLRILARDFGICYLCNHGGARTCDHIEPTTEHPELFFVESNLAAAHGSKNACTVCGKRCNQIKGGYSLERARRIFAEDKDTPPPPVKKPGGNSDGRDW